VILTMVHVATSDCKQMRQVVPHGIIFGMKLCIATVITLYLYFMYVDTFPACEG
jgi:hypothetical protein